MAINDVLPSKAARRMYHWPT